MARVRLDPLNDLYDDYESPESIQKTKHMWKRLMKKSKEEDKNVRCNNAKRKDR